MSEVSDMMKRYQQIRAWFRAPPNAVPDTGINLKRKEPPQPPPIPAALPAPPEPPSFTPTYLTFSSTVEITANEFGLTTQDLMTTTRKKKIAVPRQVAMYIATKQERWSSAWIGTQLDRDHTTILYAKKKISLLIEADPLLRNKVERIEAKLATLHRPPLTAHSQLNLEKGPERDNPPEPVLLGVDQAS